MSSKTTQKLKDGKVFYEVEVDIDVPKILRSIDDPEFGKHAADTWHKLYADYVPYRDGHLYKNVKMLPWEIEHYEPYAAPVYERNMDFRKDHHTKATAHWSEAAEPAEKPKLIKSLQNYIDQGRLKIND